MPNSGCRALRGLFAVSNWNAGKSKRATLAGIALDRLGGEKSYSGFGPPAALKRIPARKAAMAASSHSIRQICTACQSSTVAAV